MGPPPLQEASPLRVPPQKGTFLIQMMNLYIRIIITQCS